MKANIKCPCCGLVNKNKEIEANRKTVVLCDVDDGGCDREFLALVAVVTTHTVHTARLPELSPEKPNPYL